MLNKIKKSNSEGFTIIEVMIVLAVAALILLIVLLAVPALQRSSRNTSLRDAASTVAGAVSTYTSDNDGTVPVCMTLSGSTVSIGGTYSSPSCASPENINVNGGTLLGAPTAGTIATYSALPATPAASTLYVYSGATCSSGSTVTTTGASAKSIVVLYYLETSGGLSSSPQCVSAS